MPSKPKIALYWCASCGGCEESIIDMAEALLVLAEKVDIAFWPVAADFKIGHLKAMADGEIHAALINGAIRMDEQAEMAQLLRRKTRYLVAHGSCAHLGGVIGLANFCNPQEVLDRSYQEVSTVVNPKKIRPQRQTIDQGSKLALSAFHDTVKPLDQVVPVDFYIPGCPPTPALMTQAFEALLDPNPPALGSVLAESRAICHTCQRLPSRPENLVLEKFRRLYESELDPEVCFLNQGIICLGPATRGGCGSRCMGANMPCRGCFGPVGEVRDQGAKIMSFLAALMPGKDPDHIRALVNTIPDPGGLFYRYSLPSSILRRRWNP
jgi:F420-non-reducing hydrogenase small subunit